MWPLVHDQVAATNKVENFQQMQAEKVSKVELKVIAKKVACKFGVTRAASDNTIAGSLLGGGGCCRDRLGLR